MITMSEVIARLGVATGADRELDCLIHALSCWPKGKWEIAQVGSADRLETHFSWAVLRRTTDKHILIYREVPHYTASPWLPVTSAPVPMITSVRLLAGGRYEAIAVDEAGNEYKGEGADEALARLIASLKARNP